MVDRLKKPRREAAPEGTKHGPGEGKMDVKNELLEMASGHPLLVPFWGECFHGHGIAHLKVHWAGVGGHVAGWNRFRHGRRGAYLSVLVTGGSRGGVITRQRKTGRKHSVAGGRARRKSRAILAVGGVGVHSWWWWWWC